MNKINKMRSLLKVTTGAAIFFTGYSIHKNNEQFYEQYFMPLIRLLPAEACHKAAVFGCKYKLFAQSEIVDSEVLKANFFGHQLTNPIGIAAGFDKHGEAVEGLQKIGFGFIEIGSVTPKPQSGNPTPRVFRLPENEAIINRYGFNSDGHKIVYERLHELKNKKEFNGVLGVNLGKNKTSTSALDDYVQGVKVFGPIADYLVINISSPNTPGLRNLQGKQDLLKLLEGVIDARNKLEVNNKVPILLKISPDIGKEDMKDISDVITCRIDGLIVSNTTVSRENLKDDSAITETGGLSGVPLRLKSTQVIADMYHLTKGKIPIIGVGGISSAQDAFEKLEAGASYIQFYTAFIYHGPPIVSKIKTELAEIVEKNGYNNIQEVVGKNNKKYLSK